MDFWRLIGEGVCAYRRFCTRYSTSPMTFLVFFSSKKWARIDGDLQAINLQLSPPPAPNNPSSTIHQVSTPLSPCIYDAKYAVHYSFSVLSSIFLLQALECILFPSAKASSENGKPFRSDSDASGQGPKGIKYSALSRAKWYILRF